VIALTDTRDHRLAGIPGLLEAALLPVARGQQAGRLAVQVDAGLFAQAELRQIVVHAVDAHVHRQPVIVDIARLGDGAAQVDDAVPAAFPVTELVAAVGQPEKTGVGNGVRRLAQAQFEPASAMNGLIVDPGG